MDDWYDIRNVDRIDSPSLAFYPDRISGNIECAKRIIGDPDRLRPHVKTNKTAEVSRMLLNAGIRKFKCATIAEAEMLGIIGAPDVLLAYQPVGPKISRLLDLIKAYPATRYSCLVDQEENARAISTLCESMNITLDVFIDLNVGMNRTGILPEKAKALVDAVLPLKSLRIIGLHSYDGHIHDAELSVRCQGADAAYALTERVYREISPQFAYPLIKVMGGTPTFPMYAKRKDCECSPGTFVFWDWGYGNAYPDMPFNVAALLITRVISVLDKQHVCVDLGYKAVASESPLPRVHFLNHPEARPISQSEEHLVLEVPDSRFYPLGFVFYGVPVHICPTVALYDKASVIRDYEVTGEWPIIARSRRITY
ncbi:D-TA family PLP-dependent enzyme [uncultured Parabacteroides sp.]|uniref:D-TA family PLP-dependent enzyme n=1 Tax=uncultured Parabacteroides sp. TaxID=512312 RepID=UPI00260AC797|nr:D-TA family PLP-dependent enzyme [uncultured Parabacteroides sp.]